MTRFATLIAAACLLFGACIHRVMPPVQVEMLPPPVSYLADVQPILDKRCAVCHACYNAACQLKLSSFEGLDRGGSKVPVYSSSRLRPQDPTRLFIDVQTTEEWRAKKFHSVTDNTADSGYNNSILLHLLDAKMRNPQSTGDYHPEAADLTCAANTRELGSYLDRHPERGMPFGFPPVTPQEYATLASWLQQDEKGPTAPEQLALTAPSPRAAVERGGPGQVSWIPGSPGRAVP